MLKFSVIIATHNRPKLLERAIFSLQQQIYACHQIIVVSDSNCAETRQIVAQTMCDNDIFVQRTGIPGPAESRNIGMKLINGDYFIFLDDDDTFQPNFLENVVKALKLRSYEDHILYTNFEVAYQNTDSNENEIVDIQKMDITGYSSANVYVKNFIPNNCLIFPAKLASQISFDSHIAYEDWDFILSACAITSLEHLPVFGPVIHKYLTTRSEQRGQSNEAGLLECYIKIYNKHPPKNQAIATLRQELFTSIGLKIETLVSNTPQLT